MQRNPLRLVSLLAGLLPLIAACQSYTNFTTYYNRFWNMERIMDEVEDEVDYLRDQALPPQPNYYVPYDEAIDPDYLSDHLQRRSLTPEEAKANKVKLDSVLLKGSLLLTRQSESDYVDDAIFYISQAYFYQREWYLSQTKSRELIDGFPESKWQPDAHLLMAMTAMHQGETEDAETWLSRTVDVAFAFERADILTEAFRLNADLNLASGNFTDALRPYQRAIAVASDGEEQARWQYEVGVVLFRSARFEEAIKAFENVEEYDPSDLTAFQAGLQKSVAHRALGQHEEARETLEDLRDDGDFEPWHGLAEVELLSLEADAAGEEALDQETLKAIDSAYSDRAYSSYGVYERGVRALRAGDYETALVNFSQVQSSRAPFSRRARHYAIWLAFHAEQQRRLADAMRIRLIPFPDSLARIASDANFNIARAFVKLERPDSADVYYRQALEIGPDGTTEKARALYAMAQHERERGYGTRADSLLDVLAQNYGEEEYAVEARRVLGYTDDFLVDPAQDLYKSGRSYLLNAGDYGAALRQFWRLLESHPYSPFAPQALYAAGYVHERYLDNRDSAIKYYTMLVNRYPESIQAKEMKGVLEAALTGPTTGDADLVPLDVAEGASVDPSVTPPSVTIPATAPWYDPAIYRESYEEALQRRNQRTLQ